MQNNKEYFSVVVVFNVVDGIVILFVFCFLFNNKQVQPTKLPKFAATFTRNSIFPSIFRQLYFTSFLLLHLWTLFIVRCFVFYCGQFAENNECHTSVSFVGGRARA